MAAKDMERMKQVLAEKKAKQNFFGAGKKIGVGKVQQGHKNIGTDAERTKKISY